MILSNIHLNTYFKFVEVLLDFHCFLMNHFVGINDAMGIRKNDVDMGPQFSTWEARSVEVSSTVCLNVGW